MRLVPIGAAQATRHAAASTPHATGKPFRSSHTDGLFGPETRKGAQIKFSERASLNRRAAQNGKQAAHSSSCSLTDAQRDLCNELLQKRVSLRSTICPLSTEPVNRPD